MAEEVKDTIEKTTTIEKKPDEISVEKEVEVSDNEKPAEEIKPDAAIEDVDKEDVNRVITLLNEIDKANGGGGEISNIPPELLLAVKSSLDVMVAIRDSFADEDFKAILDDMVDQKADGQTPSVRVAIARNIPLEDLQDISDNENFTDYQEKVDASEKEKADSLAKDEELFANFDKSEKAIEKYCTDNNYDEAEKEELYADIAMLRDVFADGLITEAELERIDKMRNYDKDIASMESKIPEAPIKEVMPDAATLEAGMKQAPPKKNKPRNSIEATMGMSGINDKITSVGSRKKKPF